MKKRSLISVGDLSREDVLHLLKRAGEFKKKPPKELLKGNILASCFFEPSTRTRLSFEAAAIRLGANVIGFSDGENTSIKKGESLSDTMKVIGNFADVIVLRHPLEGAARCAAECTSTPVINAGDGTNQHPTQTLVDLFSMKECHKQFKGLNVAIVGDLKYGRTTHSLALACALFDMRLYLVSPEILTLPDEICYQLRKKGLKYSFHHDLLEVLPKLDIIYMTRFQKERFDERTRDEIDDQMILKKDHLKNAKKGLRILHPLPRAKEIEKEIDDTPFAYYFQQAANGIFVREAILSFILGK